MLRELLINPWWSYDPQTIGGWGIVYRWFNLFEGAVWIGFAVLVMRRWQRHRRSQWEVAYALSFLTFGLTDLREAYIQSAGLVVAKAILLVVMLGLRYLVLKRFYPEHRLY